MDFGVLEAPATSRPTAVHVPRVVALERAITEAYKPAVEALAELIRAVPVDPRPESPPITEGKGSYADPRPERVELVAADRLVRAEELSPPADPDHVRIRGRVIPVGQYGKPLAWTLAEALVLTHLPKDLPDSVVPTQDYFDRLGISRNIPDARATSVYGLISVLHSAAQFTAYRVPGFDDPFHLLKSIPTREFVELGARSPVMTLAPMTTGGFFFPGPVLRRSRSGTAVISAEFRSFLVREQRANHHDLRLPLDRRLVHRSSVGHTTHGRGCPVDFAPLIAPTIDWIHRRQQFTGGRCEP